MADEVILLKGNFSTTDPRLDRVPEFDPRSRNYQVAEILRTITPRARYLRLGPTLDQGQTSGCTGWSQCHARNATPFRKPAPLLDDAYAREWYYGAQHLDAWEGGEYPNASPIYAGSSVLGALKWGRSQGHWDSYRWVGAGSGDAIGDQINTVRYLGSVVNGVPWLNSMFDPSPSGVIEVDPTSGEAGGHAICCHYAVKIKPAGHAYGWYLVYQQSWGDFGVGRYGLPSGIILIHEDGVGWLLENGGEGGVPMLGGRG
jgi:hypothetical protein